MQRSLPNLLTTAWLCENFRLSERAHGVFAPLCQACCRTLDRETRHVVHTAHTARAAASTCGAQRSFASQSIAMPPVLTQPPYSLDTSAAEDAEGQLSRVAGSNSPFRRLLWLLGYHSNEAVNIRAATGLYDAVCSQEIHDLFQEDIEVRVRQQVSVRLRATLEELEKDFYGNALALDESLQGKCELWEPIHRNFFGSADMNQASAQMLAHYALRYALDVAELAAMEPR